MGKRALICGCGYVGTALGRLLRSEGHAVFGLRRTANHPDLLAAGIVPLQGDISRRADLAALPGPFDWVVHVASSTGGGTEEYQSVYREGLRNLTRWLGHSNGQPSRLVYTSSTSVYGQTDGSWVDETCPTEPASETGGILVAAEQLLRAVPPHVQASILRVSGIYGPGRGHLFRQFVAGKIAAPNASNRWLNMVHRDDVATAIHVLLRHDGAPGLTYNVTDNEPVLANDFLGWVGEQLEPRPTVPRVEPAAVRPSKRAETHKRVSNRLLRETIGWEPVYPTFREGYAEAIRAVKAGKFLA
jgi:nucleoside-diphosphate-sugar epimerase